MRICKPLRIVAQCFAIRLLMLQFLSQGFPGASESVSPLNGADKEAANPGTNPGGASSPAGAENPNSDGASPSSGAEDSNPAGAENSNPAGAPKAAVPDRHQPGLICSKS